MYIVSLSVDFTSSAPHSLGSTLTTPLTYSNQLQKSVWQSSNILHHIAIAIAIAMQRSSHGPTIFPSVLEALAPILQGQLVNHNMQSPGGARTAQESFSQAPTRLEDTSPSECSDQSIALQVVPPAKLIDDPSLKKVQYTFHARKPTPQKQYRSRREITQKVPNILPPKPKIHTPNPPPQTPSTPPSKTTPPPTKPASTLSANG